MDYIHDKLYPRYYNLFFYGDFLKGFSYKTCNIQVFGSLLREAIKTVKLRVVAVTHGDDYQLFSCRQKERDKKK